MTFLRLPLFLHACFIFTPVSRQGTDRKEEEGGRERKRQRKEGAERRRERGGKETGKGVGRCVGGVRAGKSHVLCVCARLYVHTYLDLDKDND